MTQKETILAVDKNEEVLALYRQHAKEQGYKTIFAHSAEEALTMLEQVTVDLVISEVLLPELDGYELCRQLKANPQTSKIPFVFVSEMTELEELIVGYSLGADEYITKPVVYDQFILKIQHILRVNKKNEEVQQQLDNYYKTAMQAMTYSSEIGIILEFYKVCISARSFRELANYIFMSVKQLDLKCSFQVYDNNNKSTGFAEQGELPPLEMEIMSLARGQSRFYDFGVRTIVSYENFSLLIKNMPIDDADKYGRLKDILGTLCDAISSRVDYILANDSLMQKQEVVERVTITMMDVDSSFKKLQKQNVAAIEDMLEELEEALLILGLTEHQEENILTIAKNCLCKTNEAFYQGVEINLKLEELHKRLVTIID